MFLKCTRLGAEASQDLRLSRCPCRAYLADGDSSGNRGDSRRFLEVCARGKCRCQGG